MASYKDKIFDKIKGDMQMESLITRLGFRAPSQRDAKHTTNARSNRSNHEEVYSLRRLPQDRMIFNEAASTLKRHNSYHKTFLISPKQAVLSREKNLNIRGLVRTVSIDKLNKRHKKAKERNKADDGIPEACTLESKEIPDEKARNLSEFQKYLDTLALSTDISAESKVQEKANKTSLKIEDPYSTGRPLLPIKTFNPDRRSLTRTSEGKIRGCYFERIDSLRKSLQKLQNDKETINNSIEALQDDNHSLRNQVQNLKTKKNLYKRLKSQTNSFSRSKAELEKLVPGLEQQIQNLSLSQLHGIESNLRVKAESDFISFLVETIKEKNINAKHLIKELERLQS